MKVVVIDSISMSWEGLAADRCTGPVEECPEATPQDRGRQTDDCSSGQRARRKEGAAAPSDKGPRPYSSMPDINMSATGIQHILSNLKPHKAAGPDTIPPTVLKELSHQISPILEIIFNKSLQTCQVPNDWKEANVAPM